MATTCKFYIRNNQLTTISGSDAGTYLIKDNFADILISGVTYHRCPFDLTISKIDVNQDITMEIE